MSVTGISVLENLSAGIYYVEVSGNGQCGTMTQTFELKEPEPLIPGFNAPSVIDIKADSIRFINTSSNSNYYSWEFGDGITSNEVSPFHKFNKAGKYIVKLKAFQNSKCFKEISKSILVNDYTGIQKVSQDNFEVNLYSSANQVYITASLMDYQDITVRMYNALGQNILTKTYRNTKDLNAQIEVFDNAGIILVKVSSNEKVFSGKVLIQ